MDQTVEEYQEHSRTFEDSHHRFKKSKMKTQNQKKKNRPFDQKCKDKFEYTHCFEFRRMNSKNSEDAEA